ncbi:MAG TPA: dual specificity protein phosphatase family protein [Candidatus Paceibacterota bacterium]|nr:dual specificity protein phosphatase family protein [Candidatus Paceibacterota bacterium]
MTHREHDEHVVMESSVITDFLTVGTNLCCEGHEKKLRDIGAELDISLEYEDTPIPKMFSTFLWLPVVDHHAPTMEQLDVGTAAIGEAEANGYRAYVHCRNGHGRGPTLAVAYFIRKGMSPAEAEEFVRSKRPEINPTDAQRNCLAEWEKRVRQNRG